MVAGCSAPQPPEVTFSASGTTIRLSPSPRCNSSTEECDATGTLPVPGGRPLSISVPGQVADAPWLVVFRYRAADGSERKLRTSVFRAGEKYAHTVTAPTAGDQLVHVEVQRIANIVLGADQQLAFTADASWSLDIT